MVSLRITLTAAAALAIAAPALATPNGRIVKTFVADVPALGQFSTPQALCSASGLGASAQVAARAQISAKQVVRVECPAFFTRQRMSGSVPDTGPGLQTIRD